MFTRGLLGFFTSSPSASHQPSCPPPASLCAAARIYYISPIELQQRSIGGDNSKSNFNRRLETGSSKRSCHRKSLSPLEIAIYNSNHCLQHHHRRISPPPYRCRWVRWWWKRREERVVVAAAILVGSSNSSNRLG